VCGTLAFIDMIGRKSKVPLSLNVVNKNNIFALWK